MIVKILGIMDIFIAICFWIFGIFGLLPSGFILFLGLYLLFKGVIFIVTGPNFPSLLDIICGLIILLSTTIGLSKFIVVILVLFLLQKGIFSLLS
jgi:hypothetical protein